MSLNFDLNIFLSVYANIFNNLSHYPYMTSFEKALNKKGRRANSVAVIGALFGDEGKGRITDEITDYFLNKKGFKEIVVYRDNGGSNAGHTISMNGKKIGLHQIGSGILHKGCNVVLGKGMVIHPSDLLEEIEEVKKVFSLKELPANLMIDEMAVLSLDTHRAFESALKERKSKSLGTQAATGRGIAPAYADVVYRFPLRMRDLYKENWKEIFVDHYERYSDWINSMGLNLENIVIQRYKGKEHKIGNVDIFINDLEKAKELLRPYVSNIYDFLKKNWEGDTPFVFEKAQAIGLDMRWGVYPDVSASNCCLDGITFSTEGIINANDISARLGVIKSTYTSSVGKRRIPTFMEEEFASPLRDDANEYGTTTGRPRDIAYMDLVMLKYFCKVGGIEELVFTHMDIVYEKPVKVCVEYEKNSKIVTYRPDQEHLDNVKPVYKEFKPWNKEFKKFKEYSELPKEIHSFVEFISKASNTKPVMLTYGPDRHDTLVM